MAEFHASQLLTVLNKIPWTTGCLESLICDLKRNHTSVGFKDKELAGTLQVDNTFSVLEVAMAGRVRINQPSVTKSVPKLHFESISIE